MVTQPATAFEMIDALGLTRLIKRRADLGGSVPMRAVQGCSPLLEGNAFGFQVCLRQAVTMERDGEAWRVVLQHPFGEALAASHRVACTRLMQQGLIRPGDPNALLNNGHFVKADQHGSGITLWTGLLVRPQPGCWLRISNAANRRNRLIEVDETFVNDDTTFVPLMLSIHLRLAGPRRIVLDGEIATLAPVVPYVPIAECCLRDAPELGLKHAGFYNERYFALKSEGITRKYRRMNSGPEHELDSASLPARVVSIGRSNHQIGGDVARVKFKNLFTFEMTFDGNTVTIDPDRHALEDGVRKMEYNLAEAMGDTFLAENVQAVLYFTRYFSPHPKGEPHFFVKPWAFVQTPPGWSTLIEGAHGDGYDVMRGVIATDRFHAVPAVFHVFRLGEPMRVEKGAALCDAIPVPRWLLQASFRELMLPI